MVIPLFSLAGEVLPIAAEMIKDKEWIPVFFSENSMVFVRDTNENHEVIHAHSIPKDIFVSKLFRMLDEEIKESPGDFRLYLTRGDLYCYVQWKFKEARREYEKVLEINPFNPFAMKKLELLNSKMQSEF